MNQIDRKNLLIMYLKVVQVVRSSGSSGFFNVKYIISRKKFTLVIYKITMMAFIIIGGGIL